MKRLKNKKSSPKYSPKWIEALKKMVLKAKG